MNIGLVDSKNRMLVLEKIRVTQDHNENNLGIRVFRD